MAVENAYRSSISLKLNTGTKANGGMIVKSCSLGRVVHGANAGKVMSVVEALAPVLEYPLSRVERTEITTLED